MKLCVDRIICAFLRGNSFISVLCLDYLLVPISNINERKTFVNFQSTLIQYHFVKFFLVHIHFYCCACAVLILATHAISAVYGHPIYNNNERGNIKAELVQKWEEKLLNLTNQNL